MIYAWVLLLSFSGYTNGYGPVSGIASEAECRRLAVEILGPWRPIFSGAQQPDKRFECHRYQVVKP